ncbi:ankyrin repeat domain-containing protein [uncultured Gimesia sp.]|uniref:ankyrin repeat domain-containing protein n=1 Tax=uncultured Gimesia sp. TaxID=1678688 RepID=UPI002623C47D|nr:ankyrin repeat domain-containing protein [uncultured Gimesia sp.]
MIHFRQLPPNIGLHNYVVEDDLQAMEDAVAQSPHLVDQCNESGLPPLYTAALFRNQRAIDFLLVHGAVVDIFACAYLGRTADAEILLNRDLELARVTTPDGMTALQYAARSGHYGMVELLLHSHADVNARDKKGRTALVEASHGGPWKQQASEEIIQLLLDHKAQVDLFTAAAIGRTELIKRLLDLDESLINELNSEGETALFVAARNNQFAAVKLLIEHGADVNQSDAVGIAALHRTSQQCSDELIQYLIDHGADAHLCCFVACGDEAGTLRLLSCSPDAACEIFYKFNAVGYAIHCWQLGSLRILLQQGSTLSEEDQQHILRISDNNRQLLNEFMGIQRE